MSHIEGQLNNVQDILGHLQIQQQIQGLLLSSQDVVGQVGTHSDVADVANRLSKARQIMLDGDAHGSALFDGSRNVSMNVAVDNKVVVIHTTAEWNSQRDLIPKRGTICVYKDGENIQFKIADGKGYLIDAPFVGIDSAQLALSQHINNTSIHINNSQRQKWNNKISISQAELANGNLVFFTDEWGEF